MGCRGLSSNLDVEGSLEPRGKEPSEGCDEGGKGREREGVQLSRIHVEGQRAKLGEGRKVATCLALFTAEDPMTTSRVREMYKH